LLSWHAVLDVRGSTTSTGPAPNGDAVVSIRGLTKRYDEIEAVAGVDFDVLRGETFGSLGPNGAGKTTTIKMLCTLATPTSGSALVAGHDVVRDRDAVRRNIGLVFQDTRLDSYLTAGQLAVPRRAVRRPPEPHRAKGSTRS
jgi:ABC-type multidrug transport system ATPase subunit